MPSIRLTSRYNYKVPDNDLAAALMEEEAWATNLRQALLDKASYDGDKHLQLAKEMDSIEARLGNYRDGTIFDHVRSIFDDSQIRGFHHDLHFPQLLNQYRRYGLGERPEQWVPPPDTESWELLPAPYVSSTAAPPSPINKPTSTPGLQLQPLANSGSAIWTDHFVGPSKPILPSAHSPSFGTNYDVRISSRAEPEVNSDIRPDYVPVKGVRVHPGCSRCERAGRPCWVFRQNNRNAACYGCRRLRVRCGLPGNHITDDKLAEAPPLKKMKYTDEKNATATEAPATHVRDTGQCSYLS